MKVALSLTCRILTIFWLGTEAKQVWHRLGFMNVHILQEMLFVFFVLDVCVWCFLYLLHLLHCLICLLWKLPPGSPHHGSGPYDWQQQASGPETDRFATEGDVNFRWFATSISEFDVECQIESNWCQFQTLHCYPLEILMYLILRLDVFVMS